MNKIQEVMRRNEEEIFDYANGIADYNWGQDKFKNIIHKSQKKLIEEFIIMIERVELDMDVIVCDCGELYRDSDPALEIKNIKQLLQDTINKEI